MNARSSPGRRPRVANKNGFSLVEVCLALGIIAFAVLPVLGLLSIGLNAYHNTELRDRSTQVLSQIGNALCLARGVTDATTGKPTGMYTAQSPYQFLAPPAVNANAIAWQWGDQKKKFLIFFDDNGTIVAFVDANATPTPPVPSTASIVAQVVLQPPIYQASGNGSQIISPGWAQIVAAWPALSNPTYTDTTGTKFTAAQGHVEITVPILTTGL